jgi:hypothetical protein
MAEKKRQSQSKSPGGSATRSVAEAANKAKVPLVAGGAAIAGAAGGFALAASRRSRRRAIQIKPGDLAKAAKEVGNFGAQMGELATELQRARESAAANGQHRSPIEVVLQGLTARR